MSNLLRLGNSFILFFLGILWLPAVAIQETPPSEPREIKIKLSSRSFAAEGLQEVLPFLPESDRHAVIAIAEAYYPTPLTQVRWLNDDAAFLINDTWIYYAKGRMLTENERKNQENYRSLMYRYRLGKLEEIVQTIDPPIKWLNSIKRSVDFQIAVTGAPPGRTMIERYHFFNKPISLHPLAGTALQSVEKSLNLLSQTDPTVEEFLKSISHLSGYAYRNVEDSVNTSMHAFGLALDIIPKSYGGKDVYWLWTKKNYPNNWMDAPFSRRWVVPSSIVEVFENHGFIWGGKWRNYDSIHFEYRPELLAYARNLLKETTVQL